MNNEYAGEVLDESVWIDDDGCGVGRNVGDSDNHTGGCCEYSVVED